MSINNRKIKLQKFNKYKMPIYDYPYTYKIMYWRSDLKQAVINCGKITSKEVLNKFHGVREATQKEINNYIKIKHSAQTFSSILLASAILLLFYSFGMIFVIIIIGLSNIEALIAAGIGFVVCIIIAFLIYDYSQKDKRAISIINSSKVYVANCYEYDIQNTQTMPTSSHHVSKPLLIKVCDNYNHYVDEWLIILYKAWYKPKKTKLLLYIFKHNDNIDLGVLTEYEIAKATNSNIDISKIYNTK